MSIDDIEKLKKLLDFWIDHNQEHGNEFAEWANKARQMGMESVYGNLMSASKLINDANTSLKNAAQIIQHN